MRPLIIIGGGGHAAVLAETARAAGFEVAGYAAPEAGARNIAPYLGTDDDLERSLSPGQFDLVIGVGSITPTSRRGDLFRAFAGRGHGFATIIHPHAIVASSACVGRGAQLMAGCVLQTNVTIGDNVIVNTRASIDHDSVVGAHTHIAPGATLCGGVAVGEAAHVGPGAVLIQNCKVPNMGFVRAGEVVSHA